MIDKLGLELFRCKFFPFLLTIYYFYCKIYSNLFMEMMFMKKIKDPVSGFTHLLGAILSVVGLVFLIIMPSFYSDEKAWDIVSFTIFGSGLILLYTFSSLYHLLNVGEKATRVLRKFDHIMIYILIASTYTPICLRSSKRWLGLVYIWYCLGPCHCWNYFNCYLD